MIAFAIYGLVMLAALLFGIYWALTDWEEPVTNLCIMTIIWIVAGGLLCIPTYIVCRATTGLAEGYGQGYGEGYVVDCKNEGLIWKTNECVIQESAGTEGAMGRVVGRFSVPQESVMKQIEQTSGKRIRVNYTSWLLTPYRLGSRSYLVTSIEILE